MSNTQQCAVTLRSPVKEPGVLLRLEAKARPRAKAAFVVGAIHKPLEHAEEKAASARP